MTCCIGDIHGNIVQYLNILKRRVPNGEGSIQLGDMGLGFHGVHLPTLEARHKFVRGNHDDPTVCRLHPNYLGDFGHLDDLFWISGAFSVDWRGRIPNISWWDEEELSAAQWNDCFSLYTQTKPRVVVSHECPKSINEIMLKPLLLTSSPYGYPSMKSTLVDSNTCKSMQALLEAHQPELWVFAHYHSDWSETINSTKFVCLGELSIAHFDF